MDIRDADVCLGILPSGGGRQVSRTCTLSVDGHNLTESLESGAAQADGRLAYVAATSVIGGVAPRDQRLVLSSLSNPVSSTSLLPIPYTIPGRPAHIGVSQVQWLAPDRLLFLGENVILFRPCELCDRDTVRSGLDAVSLKLSGTATSPEAIPGTENASGVSPGAHPDEIYYTLNGDTRVYRRILSTGEVVIAHDFGSAGIARDVHVTGTRLTAVVGGRVHFTLDPVLGPVQWDSGGLVHVVGLSDGSDAILADPNQLGLYRRPRLSPEGTALVAERYPLILIPSDDGLVVDTLVARNGDLYLFREP